MRHASIQTTMNIYGRAMIDSKRNAHSKVVEMIMKPKKTVEVEPESDLIAADGTLPCALKLRNQLILLVAGACFEAIHNALRASLVRRWMLPKNGRRPTRS